MKIEILSDKNMFLLIRVFHASYASDSSSSSLQAVKISEKHEPFTVVLIVLIYADKITIVSKNMIILPFHFSVKLLQTGRVYFMCSNAICDNKRK